MAKCCVVFSQSPFEDFTAFRVRHVLLLVSILTSNAPGQWKHWPVRFIWCMSAAHFSILCWTNGASMSDRCWRLCHLLDIVAISQFTSGNTRVLYGEQWIALELSTTTTCARGLFFSCDQATLQATGFDAWASKVKCPARFVSYLHEICIYIYIYIWVVYSLCFFCCLFITVTWWYVWCFEWASGNQEEVQACLVTLS